MNYEEAKQQKEEANEQSTQGQNNLPYKWLVMVYLAGDNNLTSECVYSLAEMKKINTGNRVKVTAQFDPRGSRVPVHRYEINKNGPVLAKSGAAPPREKIAEDVIPVVPGSKRYPFGNRVVADAAAGAAEADGAIAKVEEVNTGDPKTLFDFISWSMEAFAADHYMVVLAGHGGGTESDYLLKDENPRGSLSIRDLQRVFEAINGAFDKTIDVLGMDVCLMSMGEVCYQLRGLVNFVVGAEGYSATAGWPYGYILREVDKRLQRGIDVTALDFSRIIVNEYTNYYSEYVVGGFSADMAAIDVSKNSMQVFCESLRSLTEVLNEHLLVGMKKKDSGQRSEFLDQIVLAHWEAQSYNGERFTDLYDFCDLLERRYAPKELPGLPEEEKKARTNLGNGLRRMKEVIKEHVVKFSCFSGIDYQFSNGISVYFPWSVVSSDYKKIAFATESGWHDFLKIYTEATRRKPRGHVPGARTLWLNVERFRTGEDRTGEDRGEPHPLYGNPVYSMRNPPLVPPAEQGQSECLKEQTIKLESLDRAFFID